MNTMTTLSLADLATTRPSASRILHRHGLDFCCGGQRRLNEACADRGLDAEAILAEIDAADAAPVARNWNERPLRELIDFIVDHYHARLRVELPELVLLAAKVENRHADRDDAPHGLALHLRQVHAAVLEHLEKEEQVLFPLILHGMGSRAAAPVRAMEDEHDDHAANLRVLRDLTHDLTLPADACKSWQALYLRLTQLELELMEHIHLENNVLFPRALCE